MDGRFLRKTFLSGEEKRKYWLTRFFIGGFIILFAFGLWLNLRTGVYVAGEFFHRENAETYVRGANVIKVQQDENKTLFEATYGGEVTKATLVWEDVDFSKDTEVTITFADGEVIEGFWRDLGERGWKLVVEGEDLFGVVIYVSGTEIPSAPTNRNWSNVFCKIVFEELEKSGHIVFVLVGSFCYIMGAVGYLYPEETHELFSRWKYSRLELSEAGIFLEKVGAVASMILGVCFMLRLLPV